MTRIKIIGLALAAVFALSAATAASASAAHFEASESSNLLAKVVTGASGEQVFTTKAGKVVCKALKVKAGKSTAGKVETQLATISYENCTAFGLTATISEAEYLFHAGTTPGTGTVDVEKAITIKAAGCEVKVPAQKGLGKITYKNVGGKEVELVPNVTGITSSGTGFACT